LFSELPVGSVAKPLVAEAIFSKFYKDGRNLEVLDTPAGTSDIDMLLGVPLGGKLHAPAVQDGNGWVNTREFIAHSSNLYAAALLMLTSCNPTVRAPPNRYYINGGNAKPCFSRPGTYRIQLPWKGDFLSLYGSAPSGAGGLPSPTDASRLNIWGRYGAHGDVGGPDLPEPADIHWDWDRLDDFRADVIPLILGGQNYQWNNIVLAQSYARLLTGKRVEARIVPNSDLFEFLKFDRDQQVCLGMEDVASIGTAAGFGLNEEIARWRPETPNEYVLLSKTGTPSVEDPGIGQLRAIEEINKKIRDRDLCVAGPASRLRIDEGRQCQSDSTSQRSLSGATTLPYRGVDVSVKDGRLIRALTRADGEYNTKAYVFGVGRRATAADAVAPDSCQQLLQAGRLLIVAINVQDPTGVSGQSNAHLKIAQQLLVPGGALSVWMKGDRFSQN
jgi:hypothetical protein